MHKRPRPLIAVISALAILVAGASPGPVGAVEPGRESRPIPGRLLVFTDGTPGARAAVQREAQRRGGRVADEVRVRPDLTLLAVNTPGAPSELARLPGVREVAPDIPPVQMSHDDPTKTEAVDWGVTQIKAPVVWAAGTSGSGVVVAVVDGGVHLGHPDLEANVQGQPHANCSGDGECKPGGSDGDNDGHGTGVAGIIASADNDVGTKGVSHAAKILAVNCFEPGTFFSCLRGVYYAAGRNQNGEDDRTVDGTRAKVVNMSWGWAERDLRGCRSCVTTIETVMKNASADGLVLVASAGNAGNRRGTGDSVSYPARTPEVLAVAATDRKDQRASWSSTGPVDISAPGVGIESPYKNNAYTTWNGTSAASPHVAGVAALVLDANSNLSGKTVQQILLDTASPLGSSTQYGDGLVQADQAVTKAKSR